MKIINAMFGKGMGGIEQAFLDYNHALALQNISVHPFIHPKAKVRKHIEIPYHKFSNFSKFDPFAILKLRKAIATLDPNYVIAHGNRAISLCTAASKLTPLIAVCHNSKLKYDARIKHIFAVAEHLIPMLLSAGYKKQQITVIPNMVHIPDDLKLNSSLPASQTLRIGAISRLSSEKGVADFIKATKILIDKGINVKAYIAGEGTERRPLESLATDLKIAEHVEFMGWVEDKHDFFDKIDIFCLTSKIESFGIVLLEAMAESKFIVATRTAGATEVLQGGKYGLLAKISDPADIAEQILHLSQNFIQYQPMKQAAIVNLSKYSMLNVSRILKHTLEELSFKKNT